VALEPKLEFVVPATVLPTTVFVVGCFAAQSGRGFGRNSARAHLSRPARPHERIGERK